MIETLDRQVNLRKFRNRRFILGLASSLVSKSAAFATQIIAIPVAIGYCGLDTYALYLSLVAASLAPAILLLRLGPSFVASVARFHQVDNQIALATHFRNSIGLTLVNCLAAGLLSIAAFYLLPLDKYFAGLSRGVDSVRPALFLLSSLSILGCFFSTVESFQAGLHETHVLNARSVVSNILACVCLFTLLPFYPTVIGLIVVLQAIPFSTRFLNASLFIWRQRSTLLQSQLSMPTKILGDSLRYTFTAGFCAYAGFQAPLLILTTQTDGRRAALYAIALQLVLQLQGVVAVMLAPTIPAIANAQESGESATVNNIRRGTMWAINAMGILAIVVSIFLCNWISPATELSHLSKLIIAISSAIFFWSMAFESFLFTYILTVGTASVRNSVYIFQAIRGLLVTLVAFLLTISGLDVWAISAMAACGILAAIIPLWNIAQASCHHNNCEKPLPCYSK